MSKSGSISIAFIPPTMWLQLIKNSRLCYAIIIKNVQNLYTLLSIALTPSLVQASRTRNQSIQALVLSRHRRKRSRTIADDIRVPELGTLARVGVQSLMASNGLRWLSGILQLLPLTIAPLLVNAEGRPSTEEL